MKNLYQHNRGMSPLSAFVAIALVVVVFGIDYSTDGGVRAAVRQASAVMLSAASIASDGVADVSVFTSRKALQDDNERLRAELALTAELATRMQILEEENTALRDMAQLATEEIGVTVPVLSSYHSSLYGTFIIGSGRDQGIERGSIVLTPGGYVLGTVTAVDDATATVHGAFAPDTTSELMIGSVAFPAEGRGAGNARAEVPRDAAVVVGDVAIAAAFGSRPVGIVESIDAQSSNAVSILYIRVPTNLETLKFAYVVPRP